VIATWPSDIAAAAASAATLGTNAPIAATSNGIPHNPASIVARSSTADTVRAVFRLVAAGSGFAAPSLVSTRSSAA
jgi:hypothetical protein